MNKQLNKDNFEKYFFYGMENKDQVIKWIIMGIAKELEGTHKENDKDGEKPRYEIDKELMLKLIVQLERFTSKHDKPQQDAPRHKEYLYDDISIESKEINDMFNRNAEKIKKNRALTFLKDGPFTGILVNTHIYPPNIREKYEVYTGEQYLQELANNPNTDWGKAVYDILCYLEELEQENPHEYYSLFLDTKYARAIDRKNDKNKAEFSDEREIHEIRNVYRKFLKRSTSFGS